MSYEYYSCRGGTGGNVESVTLDNLMLNKDEKGHYLSARFIVEDKASVMELWVPKIRLCITPGRVEIGRDSGDLPYSSGRMWIDLGFGELPLEYEKIGGSTALFTKKVLKEKSVEMTLDEIEKKLGHKVKIVNK